MLHCMYSLSLSLPPLAKNLRLAPSAPAAANDILTKRCAEQSRAEQSMVVGVARRVVAAVRVVVSAVVQ